MNSLFLVTNFTRDRGIIDFGINARGHLRVFQIVWQIEKATLGTSTGRVLVSQLHALYFYTSNPFRGTTVVGRVSASLVLRSRNPSMR
jgi:hypothetical protein